MRIENLQNENRKYAKSIENFHVLEYVPAYEAVGIGLISDVLASAVSAYTYKKSGNLDVKNSLPMMISVLIVTVIGSFVASFLPERAMGSTMQIALIILGLRFILNYFPKLQ